MVENRKTLIARLDAFDGGPIDAITQVKPR